MKLISLVTGGEDAFGCDYVLVNLTPNLARPACRRVAMLKEQKHMDDNLVETFFWDAHAELAVIGLVAFLAFDAMGSQRWFWG